MFKKIESAIVSTLFSFCQTNSGGDVFFLYNRVLFLVAFRAKISGEGGNGSNKR